MAKFTSTKNNTDQIVDAQKEKLQDSEWEISQWHDRVVAIIAAGARQSSTHFSKWRLGKSRRAHGARSDLGRLLYYMDSSNLLDLSPSAQQNIIWGCLKNRCVNKLDHSFIWKFLLHTSDVLVKFFVVCQQFFEEKLWNTLLLCFHQVFILNSRLKYLNTKWILFIA